MSDVASVSVETTLPIPVKARKHRLAREKTEAELTAYNAKYAAIMKDRRDCTKEMKAINFIGSIPDYKRYKASLAAK